MKFLEIKPGSCTTTKLQGPSKYYLIKLFFLLLRNGNQVTLQIMYRENRALNI